MSSQGILDSSATQVNTNELFDFDFSGEMESSKISSNIENTSGSSKKASKRKGDDINLELSADAKARKIAGLLR